MKRRFFIYSLPRSGSSWLSVVLSSPGCYCYHEPFADGGWPQLEEMWDKRHEATVGAIDTSAHQKFSPRPEGVLCLALHRHKYEIESSLKLRGWVLNIDEDLVKFSDIAKDCIPIYYQYLNQVKYLENIWNTITAGAPFDRERAERLIEMNIQRTFASVKKRYDAYRDAEREVRRQPAC